MDILLYYCQIGAWKWNVWAQSCMILIHDFKSLTGNTVSIDNPVNIVLFLSFLQNFLVRLNNLYKYIHTHTYIYNIYTYYIFVILMFSLLMSWANFPTRILFIFTPFYQSSLNIKVLTLLSCRLQILSQFIVF